MTHRAVHRVGPLAAAIFAILLGAAAPDDLGAQPEAVSSQRIVAGRLTDEAVRKLTADGVIVIDLDEPGMDDLDAIRAALRRANDAETPFAMHGRNGDQVATAWGVHVAVDRGMDAATAVAEAKRVGLIGPRAEADLRSILRTRLHPDGDAWVRVEPHEMAESRRFQMRRALQARDMMFSRLLAVLGSVLAKPQPDGGPVAAIAVCKSEAPRIATTVAQERTVMIGRTSARLRNPHNRAPAWATALIGRDLNGPADPGADVAPIPSPRFAQHADGSLGGVLPIRLLDNCLMCHGPIESLDAALRDALGVEYPIDAATGYRVGELRGWFWVEVPPDRMQE